MQDWINWQKQVAMTKKTLKNIKNANFIKFTETFNRQTKISSLWCKLKCFKNSSNAQSSPVSIISFNHRIRTEQENSFINNNTATTTERQAVNDLEESLESNLNQPSS